MSFYDEINQVSIRDFLLSEGFEVPSNSKNEYMIAVRPEGVPSCHISDKNHLWKDFGTGEGGNSQQFVQYFYQVRYGEVITPREANLILAKVGHINAEYNEELPQKKHKTIQRKKSPSQKVSAFKVLNVSEEITLNFLNDYIINTRHIDPSIVKRYLFQVTVSLSGSDKKIHYIGFPTSNGGWQLRNAMEKMGKRCTSSYPTLINSSGDYVMADIKKARSSSGSIVIFEGFCNFLAALSDNKRDIFDADVLILNSVVNTDKAMDFILKHDTVYAFYDNDKTGKEYSQKVQQLCSGKNFRDMSSLYEGYNDYNELTISKGSQQIKR